MCPSTAKGLLPGVRWKYASATSDERLASLDDGARFLVLIKRNCSRNVSTAGSHAADEQGGGVVLAVAAGTEAAHLVDQSVHACIRQLPVREQPRRPVLLVGIIGRFRYPVRIEQHPDARRQRDGALRVRRCAEAERQPGIEVEERAGAV